MHLPPPRTTLHEACTDGQRKQWEYPALLMSVFYSASWHVSSFPSFLCACVSLFSWCSQPLLCCQQRRGRITATARRSCSPLCIAGTLQIAYWPPKSHFEGMWWIFLALLVLPTRLTLLELLRTSGTEFCLCNLDFNSAPTPFRSWQCLHWRVKFEFTPLSHWTLTHLSG